MRRLSAFLLALALVGSPAIAQQTKVYVENKSAAATLGALEAAVTLDMDGRLGAGVQITTANLNAVLTPEISCDKGVTWVASSFLTVADVSAATLTFGGGADTQIRQIKVIGCTTHVRVRVSTYTSGTSVARITATATQAASSGAAGAVTPGTTTVTGCQNLVLYGDNSSLLNCEAGFGYTASSNTFLVPSLTNSALTSGRVVISGAAGIAADDADLTFSGTRLTATDLTATTAILVGAGTAGAPALAWSADADGTGTGWYRNGANFMALSLDGTPRSMFLANSYQMRSDGQTEWCVGTSLGCGPDTALSRSSAGVLRVTTGSTTTKMLLGGGAAVASATALPLPTGNVFHVTGTTTVTSITSTNLASGVCVTLIFDGILTFTDGSNLVLAGNFVTTADDTISVCFDGTNWYETARSVN